MYIICMYHARNAVWACNHTVIHLKCMSWKAHPRCIKGVSAMFRLVGEGLGLGRMNEITLNEAVGTHILVVASWRQLPVPEVFAGIGASMLRKAILGMLDQCVYIYIYISLSLSWACIWQLIYWLSIIIINCLLLRIVRVMIWIASDLHVQTKNHSVWLLAANYIMRWEKTICNLWDAIPAEMHSDILSSLGNQFGQHHVCMSRTCERGSLRSLTNFSQLIRNLYKIVQDPSTKCAETGCTWVARRSQLL